MRFRAQVNFQKLGEFIDLALMMWSRLMMKDPERCYIGLTIKEERIYFELIKMFKIRIDVE